jgi:signal transduction histidine kinase
LGLALVKSLISHIQGEIEVSNDLITKPLGADEQPALVCFKMVLPIELDLV